MPHQRKCAQCLPFLGLQCFRISSLHNCALLFDCGRAESGFALLELLTTHAADWLQFLQLDNTSYMCTVIHECSGSPAAASHTMAYLVQSTVLYMPYHMCDCCDCSLLTACRWR